MTRLKKPPEEDNPEFCVYLCPDDVKLFRPMFNPGARFDIVAVAGMVLDRSLLDGTQLKRDDGSMWIVRDGELRGIRNGRETKKRLVPKVVRGGNTVVMEAVG